ncbi:MAG TPA: ABC transporter permease [Blastocatellia bacterium]|nr:ABC transporter permease [Blastocatellia bacterium]
MVNRKYEDLFLGVGTLLTFLLGWELLAWTGWIKPLFISSPSRIWRAAQWLFANGFWNDIRVSLGEFTAGLGLSLLVGVPAGVLLGWYGRLRAMFDPMLTALYATPRVAFVPLLILWLGIGVQSKIAVVFLGAVFPILINISAGLRSLDETLVRCARAFGANDRQLFVTVALPSSLPFLVAGMKLAIGRALVGVIVGELVASNAGIGHMMSVAGATFQADKVFVGVILLAGFGWALTTLIALLESRFNAWRPANSASA